MAPSSSASPVPFLWRARAQTRHIGCGGHSCGAVGPFFFRRSTRFVRDRYVSKKPPGHRSEEMLKGLAVSRAAVAAARRGAPAAARGMAVKVNGDKAQVPPAPPRPSCRRLAPALAHAWPAPWRGGGAGAGCSATDCASRGLLVRALTRGLLPAGALVPCVAAAAGAGAAAACRRTLSAGSCGGRRVDIPRLTAHAPMPGALLLSYAPPCVPSPSLGVPWASAGGGFAAAVLQDRRSQVPLGGHDQGGGAQGVGCARAPSGA